MSNIHAEQKWCYVGCSLVSAPYHLRKEDRHYFSLVVDLRQKYRFVCPTVYTRRALAHEAGLPVLVCQTCRCLVECGHTKSAVKASQVTITCGEALLYCKWINTCLLVGSNELTTYFALLALEGHSFCFTYQTVCISTYKFSHSCSSYSLCHPTAEE